MIGLAGAGDRLPLIPVDPESKMPSRGPVTQSLAHSRLGMVVTKFTYVRFLSNVRPVTLFYPVLGHSRSAGVKFISG